MWNFAKNKKRDIEDEREFERIDLIQSSYFSTLNSDSSSTKECWVNNISLGGISIDVNPTRILQKKDHITVMYRLGYFIRQDEVEVVHCSQVLGNWRCGCSFLVEDHERDEMIRDYIRKVNLEE